MPGASVPRGYVCQAACMPDGVCMPGGVCARVVHAQGGHACPGVSMPRGACVVRTPPPPHEQND